MPETDAGLRAGLEIHQQLDTTKLFCRCPSLLSEQVGLVFQRLLRPTQSELGEVDAAALSEARRNLQFRYETTDMSCLVEADEEPPHDVSRDALDITLQVALLVNAQIIDEIQFMRKIVIDGSNTTGFQRTALVAMDGYIEHAGRKIPIQSVCLEEDAARKMSESEGVVTYRLDRLGIPLVEVATAPVLTSPQEVRDVAYRIGSILRATRRTKRGLGTIREDLNVSIAGGARVEIKGVQELNMIASYVENEVGRQQGLLEARDFLARRGIREVPEETLDLTPWARAQPSTVLRSSLGEKGIALGLRLPGFGGLLAGRLGPELAAHARVAGVGGLLHSDELPGYGIDEGATQWLREQLRCAAEDGFLVIVGSSEKCPKAIHEAVQRARGALKGVPEETRDPLPEGRTVYSRPLPGGARMYPETDVPPVLVTEKVKDRLRDSLPLLPEKRALLLQERFQLHPQQAGQLVREGYDVLFEDLAKDPTFGKLIASTLLHTLPELAHEGLNVGAIPEEALRELLSDVQNGAVAKEGIPPVLRLLATGPLTVREAEDRLGLRGVSQEDLERILLGLLDRNPDLLRSKGPLALAPLMGEAMKELRGKVDGGRLNAVLKRMLEERLRV